jgi:hypothetical protein
MELSHGRMRQAWPPAPGLLSRTSQRQVYYRDVYIFCINSTYILRSISLATIHLCGLLPFGTIKKLSLKALGISTMWAPVKLPSCTLRDSYAVQRLPRYEASLNVLGRSDLIFIAPSYVTRIIELESARIRMLGAGVSLCKPRTKEQSRLYPWGYELAPERSANDHAFVCVPSIPLSQDSLISVQIPIQLP